MLEGQHLSDAVQTAHEQSWIPRPGNGQGKPVQDVRREAPETDGPPTRRTAFTV